MTGKELLIYNRKARKDYPLGILCLGSCYCIWQMGIILYGSKALSVHGAGQLPALEENLILYIVAGYLAGIPLTWLAAGRCVRVGQLIMLVSLVSELLLFAPLSGELYSVLFGIQTFCCVCMTGIYFEIIVNSYTPKTAAKEFLISSILTALGVVILKNDIFPLSFFLFHLMVVGIHLAVLAFLFVISKKPAISFVTRESGIVLPVRLFLGCGLIITLTSLLLLFGNNISEGQDGGTMVYAVGTGMGAVYVFLRFRKGENPIPVMAMLLEIAGAGFLLAMAATHFDVLFFPACACIGFGAAACGLSGFLGVFMSSVYPARWIVAEILVIAMSTVSVNAALLEVFRKDSTGIYLIYGITAVFLIGIYMRMKPMLSYAWEHPQQETDPEQETDWKKKIDTNQETDRKKKTDANQEMDRIQGTDWEEKINPKHGIDWEQETKEYSECKCIEYKENDENEYNQNKNIENKENRSSESKAKENKKHQTEHEVEDIHTSEDPHQNLMMQVLSQQESILADLILRGYTIKEISAQMNITENTQRGYRKNLYAKLEIHSRKELFELVSRGGLTQSSS